MELSTIGSANSANGIAAGTDPRSLNSDDFYRLLITEMQNQDPFEPNDTEAIIGQISQIRNIEVSGELSDTLATMTANNRNVSAADLIGKYVRGEVPAAEGDAETVEGVVTGIVFDSDGRIVLELDSGRNLLAEQVEQVTAATEEALANAAQSASDGAVDDAVVEAAAAANARTAQPRLQIESSLVL